MSVDYEECFRVATLRIKELESANADLVARTEARLVKIVYDWTYMKRMGGADIDLVEAMRTSDRDWLSKHDAEVAAKAVEPLIKTITWGRDLIARLVADPDSNIDAFDSEQFLKEANAILSPAPAAEGERS